MPKFRSQIKGKGLVRRGRRFLERIGTIGLEEKLRRTKIQPATKTSPRMSTDAEIMEKETIRQIRKKRGL